MDEIRFLFSPGKSAGEHLGPGAEHNARRNGAEFLFLGIRAGDEGKAQWRFSLFGNGPGGGEGRRLLQSGAISVNGEKVMKDRTLCEADFVDGLAEVQIGRTKKAYIRKDGDR